MLLESEPEWICKYLEFLSAWGQLMGDKDTDAYILDIALFLVDRHDMASVVFSRHKHVFFPLFDIFLGYTHKVRLF